MVAGIGRGDIGGNFCWNCSLGSDSAYTAGFIYLIILDGCSVYIFVTVSILVAWLEERSERLIS